MSISKSQNNEGSAHIRPRRIPCISQFTPNLPEFCQFFKLACSRRRFINQSTFRVPRGQWNYGWRSAWINRAVIVVYLYDEAAGRTLENTQFLAHTNGLVEEINDAYVRLVYAKELAEWEVEITRNHQRKKQKKQPPLPLQVGEKVIFRENFYEIALEKNETSDVCVVHPEFRVCDEVMNGTLDFIKRIVDVGSDGREVDCTSIAAAPAKNTSQRWLITKNLGLRLLLHPDYYSKRWIRRAYAITICSYQGSEVDHVGIMLESFVSQHFTVNEFYVAYTRASKSVHLFYANDESRDLERILYINQPMVIRDLFQKYLP